MDQDSLRTQIQQLGQRITWRWMMLGGCAIIGYAPAKHFLTGGWNGPESSANLANLITLLIVLFAGGYFLITNLKAQKERAALEDQLQHTDTGSGSE